MWVGGELKEASLLFRETGNKKNETMKGGTIGKRSGKHKRNKV